MSTYDALYISAGFVRAAPGARRVRPSAFPSSPSWPGLLFAFDLPAGVSVSVLGVFATPDGSAEALAVSAPGGARFAAWRLAGGDYAVCLNREWVPAA